MMRKWTAINKPIKGVSTYDHMISETPLGRCIIEWKSWKEYDSYSVTIGDVYVGEGITLEEAKELSFKYILNKYKDIAKYLKDE